MGAGDSLEDLKAKIMSGSKKGNSSSSRSKRNEFPPLRTPGSLRSTPKALPPV